MLLTVYNRCGIIVYRIKWATGSIESTNMKLVAQLIARDRADEYNQGVSYVGNA